MQRTAPAICLLLFLAACSTAIPASPALIASPQETLPLIRTATLPPALSATPPPIAPALRAPSPTPESSHRPHYELRLALDYARHLAGVDETITYTNRTAGTLNELVLAVEPRLWPGTFILTDLKVDGKPANADFSGERMSLKLAQPLAAGGSVSLLIGYELQIPSKNQRYQFGYSAYQTNLLDWYPFVVPNIPGKGWVLHSPAPVGEHLVYESADFDVFLKLSDPSNPPVVAAGAPGAAEGEWMHYRLLGARGFSLSASDHFLVSTAEAGGVSVTSYYFDGHRAAGTQAAKVAAEAVWFFSRKFAPYPYETLSIVESSSEDGMEADGLFFMGGHFYDTYNGTQENYLTALSVHETAHQWWYGLVGSDQALEPWLDEALATYSERLFYEANYPDHVNWWWYFRIRRFNPLGAVNGSIYDNGSFRTYTNATYFVGAYWLEDLRVRIGDDVFFATLSDYASRNAYQIASAETFFAILNQHTGVDYSDIVNQYFK